MGKGMMNLQDSFLNSARRQNVHVTIALNDGTKIKGRVNGFDNFTVILDCNKIQHLIYKHAIATIFPDRPLEKHHPSPQPQSSENKTTNNHGVASSTQLEKFKVAMESK